MAVSGPGSGEGLGLSVPSGSCCGRAGGSVSAASPGYFIKEEEKKIKVSGGGDADFL